MRTFAVALLLLLAAGCGGSGEEAVRTATVTVEAGSWAEGDCSAAGEYEGALYRVCTDGEHGHVDRLDSGRFERVAIRGPGGHGAWHWGAVSPDGRMLLLQWHAECEIPIAFVVSTRGGAARPVTGEQDWTKAPESVALGWTTDGEPIVYFPRGICGRGADEPGTYVVERDDLRRVDEKLEPSLGARDL